MGTLVNTFGRLLLGPLKEHILVGHNQTALVQEQELLQPPVISEITTTVNLELG